MIIKGNIVQVIELQKDITVDGLIQKYDDNSPYMFGKVINANKKILNELNTLVNDANNAVILFKRISKIPYLNTYFVDENDIIAVMDVEEFDNL